MDNISNNLLDNKEVLEEFTSNNVQSPDQFKKSQYHYFQSQPEHNEQQSIEPNNKNFNQQNPVIFPQESCYHQNQNHKIPAQRSVNIQKFEVQVPAATFLRKLDPKKQFYQVRKALGFLAIYQILLMRCLIFLGSCFQNTIGNFTITLLVLIPLYSVLLFLSNFQIFRKKPFSLILYLVSILLASLILFFHCTQYSNKKPPSEDGIYITEFDAAIFGCLALLAFIFCNIILILIYLCFEKQKIQFFIILPVLYLSHLLVYLIWDGFLTLLVISFWYNLFLLISIQQSLQGRFFLRQNEILNTANAYNYGIVFPFWISKY